LDTFEGARQAALLDWHDRNFCAGDIAALPECLGEADVVINCVLWPKERNDHLITRAMLKEMKPGALIVDISCDTAGAVETSRPTSWSDPVYVVDGVRHFCVDNVPGAVPVTASAGYGEAIMPRVAAIADRGLVAACKADPWLARGLTCVKGELFLEEAARVQHRPFTPVEAWLARQE
jgi:alanine dehydrogenase